MSSVFKQGLKKENLEVWKNETWRTKMLEVKKWRTKIWSVRNGEGSLEKKICSWDAEYTEREKNGKQWKLKMGFVVKRSDVGAGG